MDQQLRGSILMSVERDGANKLRTLIVGCGNIAGGFDRGRSQDDFPFTHAGAYLRDGRFGLSACVEPDDVRRTEFMTAWGVTTGYRSIKEITSAEDKFDVISICSPTICHTHDMERALLLKPKLIFCEKPFTTSVIDTERLVSDCLKAGILLAVNHTRRWDADVKNLRADMLSKRRGQLRSVLGIYNKGILNNGSHMLDLLHFLLGEMQIIKVGTPVSDYFENDRTIPVWLESANGVPIHLACGHAEDYAIFELQLIFSHGVLTMEEGGMNWRERRAIDSAMFKGYRTLEEIPRRAGAYPRAMLEAVRNIYAAITQSEKLNSTGETALYAQQLCNEIVHQTHIKQFENATF